MVLELNMITLKNLRNLKVDKFEQPISESLHRKQIGRAHV